MIQFAHPMYLWLGGAAVVVLALLFARAARKRRDAIRRLSAANPTTSLAPRRRLLRDVLAVLGVAFAFIALARPLGGYRLEAAPTRGVDLMFAVDTSKSMRAADLRPDRLTRAKLAVTDLARSLDTARLGLIAFAGDAFVQAPMTADRGVFLDAVDALDTDVIPRGGTDVSSAIRAAEEAMASEPDHHKVLVLLSDGEDLAGSAVAAARDAAAHGLTIYTVGVGSEQGSLIELTDATGHKELVRDEAGQPVRSHLDERTLRAIAQVTGGAYAPLGASGRGLDQLLAQARAHLPATTAAGTQRRVYAERFQIPLGLALACLLAELVIGDRRRRRRVATPAPARPRTARLGLAALVAGIAVGAPAVAGAAPVTDYNAGTSAYRKGDFGAAEKQFESALHSRDVALQADAYYDLGNARYRQGEATVAKDRAATIATWKHALEAYDAALALAPKDTDARFNRDFVARKLAALEEAQKKQEEQQKQQGGQGQQHQKQQGGQGQQQNQSGQQGQQQNQSGQQGQQQNQSGQQRQQQNQSGQGQQNQSGQQGQQPDQSGQQGQQRNQSGQQGQPQNQSGQQSDKNDQRGQQSDKNGQQSDKKGKQGQQPDKSGHQQGTHGQPDAPDAAMGSDHTPQGTIGEAGQGSASGSAAAASAGASNGSGGDRADAAEARADAARRAAGQLTRGEAVQLLDSVAHDLKPMPIRGRTSGHPTHTTIKDW